MAISAHSNALHARYFFEAVSALGPLFFVAFDEFPIAVLADHDEVSDVLEEVVGLLVPLDV